MFTSNALFNILKINLTTIIQLLEVVEIRLPTNLEKTRITLGTVFVFGI